MAVLEINYKIESSYADDILIKIVSTSFKEIEKKKTRFI